MDLSSGFAVGVALVIPILVGLLFDTWDLSHVPLAESRQHLQLDEPEVVVVPHLGHEAGVDDGPGHGHHALAVGLGRVVLRQDGLTTRKKKVSQSQSRVLAI